MSYSQGQRDIIFEVPRPPQPIKDGSDLPLHPLRKNTSPKSMDGVAVLPALSYSGSAPGQRVSSHEEIGTEYNPPTRGGTLSGASRVRSHYVSLSEAITDDSQPDFNPERLYTRGNNNSSSTLEDKGFDPSKLSPNPGGQYAAYPPTPDYGFKSAETGFLKTPSPSLFPRGLPKPPKKHPFSQSYEAPEWKTFTVHLLLCLLAYPFLLIFVILARGRTLFWTRLLVGVGCGLTGFLLGLSLVGLARRHLEASAWATVIHQSKYHDQPGVRLKDLAPHAEDPVSAYNGLMLLWNRHMYPGTARKNRAHYDPRPWSVHIIYFLALIGISAMLPFIFGRIVNIDTRVENQRAHYYETAIKGDSSDADIEKAAALEATFNDFRLTWTLAESSSYSSLPPVVELLWKHNGSEGGNDRVYFSETTKSQLEVDGTGIGTFDEDVTMPELDAQKSSLSISVLQAGLSPGNVVRQPRWGIRMKCVELPDAANNILPISKNLNRTYIFVPRDTIKTLLEYFEKPFPTDIKPPTMAEGDQDWPSNVNQSATLLALSGFFNNGVNHAYASKPLFGMGKDDTGFVSFEAVLIRLNTTFAAEGKFPILGEMVPDINGTATHIGYDAAVCIEVFEPWVVEVYNSTVGAPTTLRIVEKKNVVGDFATGGLMEKRMGKAISGDNVRRELTSKRIQPVYVAAHQNSVNQILKDNGRDSFYVPSRIAISYTTGQGAYGYTSLNASRFERSRALADADNLLPYFAGSGLIVARVYPDRVLAYAFIEPIQMVAVLLTIFISGALAAFFVPRLPMHVPRRGFELYSWVAAFYADELVGVGKDADSGALGGPGYGHGGSPGQGQVGAQGKGPVGLPIGRRMEIEEIEQYIGNVRFRYVS